MTKYYLRVEGVNLNNFVYDTNDLSTIRGSSMMLLEAIRDVERKFTQLRPVSTGASSGLFWFEGDDKNKEEPEATRKAVDAFLRDGNNRHATFVVDAKPAKSKFVNDYELLLAKNRWRQMSSLSVAVPTPNSKPGVRVCEFDRVSPGTVSGEKSTSESARVRRDVGRSEKQHFVSRELGYEITRWFATDLGQLTDDVAQGNLHHKMAVIYLDGNRFGSIQNSECKSEEKLRQFDSEVKAYRKSWLKRIVERMDTEPGWIVGGNKYRLEILQWGGDETLWVVPAWRGWETLALLYEVSKEWKFDGRVPLTHAAGIVFCHHNAPIRRIKHLAEALAKKAKEKSRDQNLFSYEILESFDHIGREIDHYMFERCPNTSKASSISKYDRNKVIRSTLVLPGEKAVALWEPMRSVKHSIPRRKLVRLVRGLLNHAQVSVEYDLMLELFKGLMDSATLSGSDLETLISGFNGDGRWWLGEVRKMNQGMELVAGLTPDRAGWWVHMNALWDYIGITREASYNAVGNP
jgi:hypothetical protein